MQLYGNHVVGIDMKSDTLTQAMTLLDGQSICWSNSSATTNRCLVSGGGFLNLQINGSTPWYIDGAGGQYVPYLRATATTASTSPTTGAIIDAGGLGVAGAANIGGSLTVGAGITEASSTLIATTTAFANGAASATATLTNGPTAGNPTKWIPINDNGTTRYIPAW